MSNVSFTRPRESWVQGRCYNKSLKHRAGLRASASRYLLNECMTVYSPTGEAHIVNPLLQSLPGIHLELLGANLLWT